MIALEDFNLTTYDADDLKYDLEETERIRAYLHSPELQSGTQPLFGLSFGGHLDIPLPPKMFMEIVKTVTDYYDQLAQIKRSKI